ncbi:unnamed protein product [Oikopleura dioica]|uniref:Uncharacterized protein n=1 Tax=Oikopleura dioica TaxID=34765 RepID=E4XGD8_OIKDI|nr:unnamed protein product [Oikopleura dioica]CBY36470.1 unnamed protein product [Oikopleura dioica]
MCSKISLGCGILACYFSWRPHGLGPLKISEICSRSLQMLFLHKFKKRIGKNSMRNSERTV